MATLRRLEIEREVASLKATQPGMISTHGQDYTEVDRLEPDDNSAFEILSDDRVVDMRAWKDVPEERGQQLYSAISQTRRIRLKKIKPAKIFQTQGRTTGLDVFLQCRSPYPAREVGQKGVSFVGTDRMKVRRLLIDVSSVPEHSEFDLRVVTTYWNSLQTDSELWFGIIGYKHSFKVSLLLLFPEEKPMKNYALMVSRTIKDKPVPYVAERISMQGPSRDWVYWEVPNPKEGYVHRLEWRW